MPCLVLDPPGRAWCGAGAETRKISNSTVPASTATRTTSPTWCPNNAPAQRRSRRQPVEARVVRCHDCDDSLCKVTPDADLAAYVDHALGGRHRPSLVLLLLSHAGHRQPSLALVPPPLGAGEEGQALGDLHRAWLRG